MLPSKYRKFTGNSVNYISNIVLIMDYMDSSQSNIESQQQNRNYKCPCGKAYLSNAAIFTHVKQKHGGKAPGPIEKPKLESKPRGRPPLAAKNKNAGACRPNSQESLQQAAVQRPEKKIEQEAFNQLFVHLADLSYREIFSPEIWSTVDTFRVLQNFIETRPSRSNFKYKGVCIGIGLSEFLKEVSQGVEQNPWRFQQLLILMVLLLQYVIDQNNSQRILQQAPVQLLIDYINPFIRDHIQDYAQLLTIQDLWVMKQENMTKIFVCFYHWLKWKDYTQYCITLI